MVTVKVAILFYYFGAYAFAKSPPFTPCL
jgi:hypothetical protein